MNPEELKESAEHAHLKGEKEIGLTMAVVAVLLAVTTLLSHRSHTEEVLLQGKANSADPTVKGSNRDAIGTQVLATWQGGQLLQEKSTGYGYISESSPVLHFGLGKASAADLVVRWPTGQEQTFSGVAPGSYQLLEGGKLEQR